VLAFKNKMDTLLVGVAWKKASGISELMEEITEIGHDS
jgi:hypothetical protein